MHPSTKIFDIECGEHMFDPFVDAIPRKMQKCIVYVIDMLDTPFVKIGSTSNPRGRITTYNTQSPFLIVCPFIICPPTGVSHIEIEREAQRIMSLDLHRGEWFRCGYVDAIRAILVATTKLQAGIVK
jgi:hypothetical protein